MTYLTSIGGGSGSASWGSIGGASGTIQLMQRSEIAASNTVLQATLTIMGYRTI